MTRADQIADNLAQVRDRIDRAVAAAGRDAGSVALVAVTKFFPADDVRILAGLGVRDVGESRHQEAGPKAAACAGLGLRWHFIGGLQTNKAAAVAGYADVIESVDRARLIAPLDRGAQASGRVVEVLVQVSLDHDQQVPGSDQRRGVAPEELAELADRVAQSDHLQLAGLMAVAPLGADPVPAFERLAQIRGRFLADHPDATELSAGMSADLEAAIACGATHVRVGSAILGSRPPVQ